MVQFCPKCGTQAPDDESVFCNKCGARLPPVVPVKQDIVCPRCGTKITDEHSVFCDRCGSPLPKAPQPQARQTRKQPAAAPPVVVRKRCISCGAPLAYEDTDYCDACLAHMSRPEPPAPLHRIMPEPEPIPAPRNVPEPEQIPPAIPVAVPVATAQHPSPEPDEPPTGKRNRKTLIIAGAIALVAIIVLAVIAGFVTGMIPGIGKDNTTAPAAPAEGQTTATTIPTKKVTTPTATKTTPSPGKTTITTIPTPDETTNESAAPSVNATMIAGANTTGNVTANMTPSVTKPLSNIEASKTFSVGETATDGKGKLTLNGYSLKDKLRDPTPSNAIGKKYLILNITYENLQQNATTEVDLRGMTVEDAGAFTFDQVSDDPMLENPFYFSGKTVPPLENRTGNMAFIISPDATFLKFRYDFGNGKIATFQLPQYL